MRIDNLGILDEALAHGLEDVVHHDRRGLALGNGFAGGVDLVLGEMVDVVAIVGGDLIRRLVAPLLQVDALILKGVGQLVGQNRLLLVDRHPVEHVHGLGLGVVIGLDLLLEQGQQERLQVEVAIEQAELLQHDFAALQALGALVLLEFLVQIRLDGVARGELALDRALSRAAPSPETRTG